MDRIGVLLLQLGTPASADPASVRRYLAEFLSDPRVVDMPRLLWLPLLHGVILRFRPKKSAILYKGIWMENGLSPLMHYSLLLEREIGRRLGSGCLTRLAMRYGQPSVDEVLLDMRRQGLGRLLVVPLFPHYSGATTGSAIAKVFDHLSRLEHIPPVRIAPPFYDHAGYIESLVASIRAHHPPRYGRHYLFSFHGLPTRHIERGDPYYDQCTVTANLLARTLPLAENQWTLSFQSRFGPESWLEPDTAALLKSLPAQGVHDVVVICPGFVADCLETLEEIALSGRKLFLNNGGDSFGFVPCLNDSPEWLAALTTIIDNELSGWSVRESDCTL